MAARRGITSAAAVGIKGRSMPPRVSSPKRVDVCVVGAGVMGSSAALAAVRYVFFSLYSCICVEEVSLSLSLSLVRCVSSVSFNL